jgi:hypothetical protein
MRDRPRDINLKYKLLEEGVFPFYLLQQIMKTTPTKTLCKFPKIYILRVV